MITRNGYKMLFAGVGLIALMRFFTGPDTARGLPVTYGSDCGCGG